MRNLQTKTAWGAFWSKVYVISSIACKANSNAFSWSVFRKSCACKNSQNPLHS